MSQAKTCPVKGVMEVDFNSQEFQENYKEVYKRMHESGCPFAHSASGDHYAFAAHADVLGALLDTERWSSRFGPGLGYMPANAPGVLVNIDPPDHALEAKLVGRVFSKAYFDSFEDKVRDFLNRRVNEIYPRGQCDLHKELSEALPLFLIFEMFGIELGDRGPQFRKEIVTPIGMMLAPGDIRQANIGDHRPFSDAMFREHLAKCKAGLADGSMRPDDNLVTLFLSTEIDGFRLSEEKILAFCDFLLAAGTGTTTILLSNLVYRLLSEDLFQRVVQDRKLIATAIEECLRLDSPVHGLFRTNDAPVEIGPLQIEQDTKVMMLWGAANLDPDVFSDPNTFNIDRPATELRKHLSFGYGIHICRGAPLARMEARLLLEVVSSRLPNLRIAGEVKPEYTMPVLQGISELPVAWDINEETASEPRI